MRKPGEKFIYNNVKLITIKGIRRNSCAGCYFHDLSTQCHCSNECGAFSTVGELGIIFKPTFTYGK